MNVHHKNWLKFKCQNYVSNLTCQLCFNSLNFRFQPWNFKRGCSNPHSLPVWRLARIITPITAAPFPHQPGTDWSLCWNFKSFSMLRSRQKKIKSYRLPSLKLTASLPLQVNGWKMNFLLEYLLWRGRVSFRSVNFNHLSVHLEYESPRHCIAHLLVISQGNWFTQAAI